MRLRLAVLQTPAKSSVLPRLPLHNNRPLPTHSESTLPQLLIPLHFNFPRINTYKKPRGGCPSTNQKVFQLVTPNLSLRYASSVSSSFSPFNFEISTFSAFSRSPFPAALTSRLQIIENKTTLSPAVATLADCVMHKSFVCHSCKKTPGGGVSAVGQPLLAGSLGFPTGRGPRVAAAWFTRTVAPHGTKCQNHTCYWLAAPRETYPLSRCLIERRADVGFGIRRLPNPVASRSQRHVMQGSHEQEGLGPPF